MTVGTMLLLYSSNEPGLSDGEPRAFECLLPLRKRPGRKAGKPCGFVTKTKRGMKQHQRLSHNFKPQQELFVKKEQTDECCSKSAPGFSWYRREGERFTCSNCGSTYQWVTDEAEGSYWEKIDGIKTFARHAQG